MLANQPSLNWLGLLFVKVDDTDKRLEDIKEGELIMDQLEIWIEIGQNNPWISEASDPHFNRDSFYECESLVKLQENLAHGNWSLGQAFHLDNICFIQQVNGGNEWLVIKDEIAFESISYKNYQSQKFEQFIADIKQATAQELKQLNY